MVLRAGAQIYYGEMSQHEEDEPVVRARRKTVLPVRYEDYNLSGFTLPKLFPECMSPHSQLHPTVPPSLEPEDCARATGITPQQLPHKELDNPLQWSDDEPWGSETSILQRENRDLRLAHDNLLQTLQTMQQERDTFQQATDRYSQELSQLKQQMQQLQIQMVQQQPAEQFSPPVTPTRPVPAPRRLLRTQQSDKSIAPLSAPRVRPAESDQPEHSSETFLAPTAVPSAKPTLPYHTSHSENVKWDESRVERTYYSRAEMPDRLSCTSYEPESAVPPSFGSPRRSHLPCRASSPVPPELEQMYRGPTPTIPDFVYPNPREFSRLKIALENILPATATERFKFQILTDHLKLEEAQLIADSYSHSQQPFTKTMAALDQQYGQPHQLALQRIAELMDGPNIASGDIKTFRLFALKVRSLVGMLEQLGKKGTFELQCGSHVSRLLGKLPHDLRSSFRRFAHPYQVPIPTLLDLSEWLEYEIQVQEDTTRFAGAGRRGYPARPREVIRDPKTFTKSATILLGTEKAPPLTKMIPTANKPVLTPYCPYCDHHKHSLNNCNNFKQLTIDQKRNWIKDCNRCCRCGRNHQASECNLRMRCKQCNSRHLLVLHDINLRSEDLPKTTPNEGTSANACLLNTMNEILLIRKPPASRKVLLKIVKVILRNGAHKIKAYAILDDGSERTILLHNAAQQLGLKGQPEDLPLRTVRQELQMLTGASVSFHISPLSQPSKLYRIKGAFTAQQLSLAEHTHPVKTLREKYHHLRGLPLSHLESVRPVLLIGSDYPHLITAVEPIRLGPPGGPAAIKTRLGWALQGPVQHLQHEVTEQQCLLTSVAPPETDLLRQVERLWQMDVLPWQSEKMSTRSRQDQEAVKILESKTVRVEVDGVKRYATPLLRVKNMPDLKAPKNAVLPHLRATERRLAKDPEQAAAYTAEIQKLERAGYAVKVELNVEECLTNTWYIPHHLVQHNGKNRVVFNCSFQYQGQNLNKLLLPGPVLGPSLLAVLLRFREHSVAISSDIKGMFHQIRLLPEDRPLLRFLWRDLNPQDPPNIYEWQVLPFGTTCSPCCAIFALQKHILDHSQPGEDVRHAVLKSFYVDNFLQSFTSVEAGKGLVDKLRSLLAEGGFDLRQWSSNQLSTISHLPPEARSDSTELWISQGQSNTQESALGLLWNHQTDTLSYKYCPIQNTETTMRSIYRIIASQYDPLGYLIPYTTKAKLIVQRLWDKKRDWDDPHLPADLLQTWTEWVEELPALQHIVFPRCYTSPIRDTDMSQREIHIFCDASERAYGSVAYLRTEDQCGEVEVAFLTARSRVAPKKQQSIPRLELCAALTGAQLAKVVRTELNLPIHQLTLWTDSTTVLTWLHSDSCRFKVFVGTRVAEIQDITDQHTWRYVPSTYNPADDITRGKSLCKLGPDSHWYQGPSFLKGPPNQWPEIPHPMPADESELRKTVPCLLTCFTASLSFPDFSQYKTFEELLESRACHGAAGNPTADDYKMAEISVLQQAQEECFPSELEQLKADKSLPRNSRLKALAPELNHDTQLIRVGGRLRCSPYLDPDTVHPIVLDPKHPVSKLLIQSYDTKLHHPGPERVFAELRRKYWILRGREAIKRCQRTCVECQKWRRNPEVPKMADLPPARLRLFKPAFYSTGMDCFGPYTVKVGRRNEKKWGILFKCLTTRAVYIDILHSLDSDSFLMALRRFIARRGKPFELLSDQGTNFKGGERELKEAYAAIVPELQQQLASQQIQFHFNPPNSPHFGGSWEREIRSLKQALMTTLGAQSVTFEVMYTVLVEIEGILNSKPLGYSSSDISDLDPITPNSLLMGRPDSSLPPVIYPESELISQRRWRHSQVLADQFWRRFIRFYLPSLQTRQKWQDETSDLQVGTIVLIVDPQLPRALWPVGQVSKVFPGVDRRVRAAEIKVGKKSYTRPVARLIRLPAIPD
ncbi:uncharacterized protein LOC113066497 [Carassius auratus]|uniref:ribonuclease H n=1 Tax=Carassius auratus TaxID=7957 RepID=A0A6P6MC87_CARAU|nr:uncharacterized protein LOC113066497 [Carassius auratus]